jgi:cell division protein FtsB
MNAKTINWIIVIIGIVLLVNISRSIIDLSARSKLVSDAQERLREVQEKNARLREEYRRVQSDEYIEEVAREKLGLGKEGEIIYVLPKTDKLNLPQEQVATPAAIWKEWINLFL